MNTLNFPAFEGQIVRRVWHAEEWFFSAVDIVSILSSSANPRNYWNMMKKREPQLYTICVQLPMEGQDGRFRKTDTVTFEGSLRLIQSIPSKQAEPLKLKLAELAKQKLEEIANPSLAVDRAIETYQKRGRDEEWIQLRLLGTGKRKELTDEWKDRGVQKGYQYGQLTNTLHEATFDLTTKQHKETKELVPKHNLRDHMSSEELALTMLAETATRSLHQRNASHGFESLKTDAKTGGLVANSARKALEEALGRSVITKQNFLKRSPKNIPLEETGNE